MNKLCLLAALLVIQVSAMAGQLEVSNAWVRASVPGQSVASAFVTLGNPLGEALHLNEIRSKAAKTVELHTHKVVDGQMRMRRMENFSIPAGGKAVFRPGENHIMLIGLLAPLREGDRVSIDMCFEEFCTKVDMPVVGVMNEAALAP